MKSKMKISVIVPVWNDVERIESCVNSLKSQEFVKDQYEIIVVDNGSTDGTYEKLLSIKDIIVLNEQKAGSYAARNAALKIAQGEYLAFTDSDCIPSKNWLSELLKTALSDNSVGIVAGNIKFFEDPKDNVEPKAIAYESIFSMNQEKYASEGLCITANWFSPRELLINLGGFNSDLKSGGDHEMARRVSSYGSKVIFARTAVVAHPARNKKEILKKRRRVIGGSWDSMATNTKFIKMSWGAFKLLVKRLLLLSVSKKIGLKPKVGVAILLLEIFFVSIQELWFLKSGRISARS